MWDKETRSLTCCQIWWPNQWPVFANLTRHHHVCQS